MSDEDFVSMLTVHPPILFLQSWWWPWMGILHINASAWLWCGTVSTGLVARLELGTHSWLNNNIQTFCTVLKGDTPSMKVTACMVPFWEGWMSTSVCSTMPSGFVRYVLYHFLRHGPVFNQLQVQPEWYNPHGELFREQHQVPSCIHGCFAQKAYHSAREGSLSHMLSTHTSLLHLNIVDWLSRASWICLHGWFPRWTSTPRIMERCHSASTRVTGLFSTSCLSGISSWRHALKVLHLLLGECLVVERSRWTLRKPTARRAARRATHYSVLSGSAHQSRKGYMCISRCWLVDTPRMIECHLLLPSGAHWITSLDQLCTIISYNCIHVLDNQHLAVLFFFWFHFCAPEGRVPYVALHFLWTTRLSFSTFIGLPVYLKSPPFPHLVNGKTPCQALMRSSNPWVLQVREEYFERIRQGMNEKDSVVLYHKIQEVKSKAIGPKTNSTYSTTEQ